MSTAPLWTCPHCGRRFTRPGQSHSCGSYSVERFLEGKPQPGVRLYRDFEQLALSVGEVTSAPAKTRVGFQNRRIFAAVNNIAANRLDVHIVTAGPIRSERVRRLEELAPDCSVNHLWICSPQDLDSELRSWLEEGYQWGLGEEAER